MLEAYDFKNGQLLFFFPSIENGFLHAIVRLPESASYSRRQLQATAGSVAVVI